MYFAFVTTLFNGAIGAASGAFVAGAWAFIQFMADNKAKTPESRYHNELDGLRESVAGLLPTVKSLREDVDRANERADRFSSMLDACLERDRKKSTELFELRREVTSLRREVTGHGATDRTEPNRDQG